MVSVGMPMGGRIVTVHLHAGGIAAVYDPIPGAWELRQARPERRPEQVGNMAAAIPQEQLLPVSLVGGTDIGRGATVADRLTNWIRR